MVTENQAITDIANLAEQAAGELLGDMPTLKDAKPIDRGLAISFALRAEQGSAARLKAAISDDSSFGELRGGWIQCRGQGGGFGIAVGNGELSRFLINGVIDGHSAKSLIAEARAFAVCGTSITESYTPLAGVTVTEAVGLGRDIDLIPWTDVPDGDQKTKFGPDSSPNKSVSWMKFFPPIPATATSAIRFRSAECKVLFSSSKDVGKATEASADENIARSDQIRDVVRCITALSVHPVTAIGNWTRFNKKIANDVAGGGYSYTGAIFESAVREASSNPVAVDGRSVAELFHHFEEFETSEKSIMRVAIDRLNQAIRRESTVDKAIDLGIALEVMLLHGIGEMDRGELRFRSSIRGATFLGGKKPERLTNFKLLKNTYDLRSKAVHSGNLKKKGPLPEQMLEDATSTCACIARKLIELRSFPNWDAEYVIGGEQ